MRIALFYHSLISDWNNGNAHFLRGIATELIKAGHDVTIYEPSNAWSTKNLIQSFGYGPIKEFYTYFPNLKSVFYNLFKLELPAILENIDLVIVHEWNQPRLINMLADQRKKTPHFRLLFHDTHHRCVNQPESTGKLKLYDYDGVLAFGKIIADIYTAKKWAKKVWVWHEAADTNIFKPEIFRKTTNDLVWVGNWGDDERSEEINEFLIKPAHDLKLNTSVYGVRYPEHAIELLQKSGISYKGWVANYKVPDLFNSAKLTLHIPRNPYTKMLPGIPTIRVFEALACGLPLICSPWQDTENLFTPGKDFLMVKNGNEMKMQIMKIIHEQDFAANIAEHGRKTILDRHTCAHRVNSLLNICQSLDLDTSPQRQAINV